MELLDCSFQPKGVQDPSQIRIVNDMQNDIAFNYNTVVFCCVFFSQLLVSVTVV